MKYRTDIAFEVIHALKEEDYHITKMKINETVLNFIQILKENNSLDKSIGDYITIDIAGLEDEKQREETAEVVKEALKMMICENHCKILVVGLGNEEVTADALGPKVAENIIVTSHLFRLNKHHMTKGCSDVSVLIPRVMGQTGIETAELVKAVSKQVNPDLVIAIDALATSSIERINRVIQITNTGIRPGAGVGNHRMAIDEASLGVPVIAIGVATVVSVEALIFQVLDAIGSKDLKKTEEYIQNSECYKMIVTPKEMDEDVLHLVEILSEGINRALHFRYKEI